MAWACVGPFLAVLMTAAVVEFLIMRGQQSLTMSLQAFCHVVFMCVVGFAVVLAVTEGTKPIASRFRPDFLARCKPAGAKEGMSLGLDTPVTCTGKDSEVLLDGRRSFPSGHSSNTLSICWYCVVYLFHALYWREGFHYMGGIWTRGSSWWMRVLKELMQGLVIIWGCLVMCMAWFIGVSRYTDHRHNIDDILGGFMAALLWMTPILIISLGQLSFFQKRLREDEEADAASLPLTVKTGTGDLTPSGGSPVAAMYKVHPQGPSAGEQLLTSAPPLAAPTTTTTAAAAAGPPEDGGEMWYDAQGSSSMKHRAEP
eukprot:gene7321-7533_t